jgi:hypothetical protein
MTVDKLRDIEKVVKPILEKYPIAREDDYILYVEVIKEYNAPLLYMSAGEFLTSHLAYNVPNMKSIERARRKIQAKHPELASERAKKKRAEQEQEYIEYAVGE